MSRKRPAASGNTALSSICLSTFLAEEQSHRSTRDIPLSRWLKTAMLIQRDDEKAQTENRSLVQPSRTAGTTDLSDLGPGVERKQDRGSVPTDFKASGGTPQQRLNGKTEKTEDTSLNGLLTPPLQSFSIYEVHYSC